ncbi:hypothetical protein R3W88_014756 [Solanum pinnatisectum]|uniref:Reverse transcriptase zinc-binding domain-containing protein n=1 Tax=Solanum pinnatisectum TaxID=50273 RepID=A0AAV9KTC0_9SOLN|nr:hypothetical protein R3W88_014756 [Solanum pinnatisectum]
MNLCTWNSAAILKLLWDIDRKKDCIWVQWVRNYYVKQGDISQIWIPKNASWVVRKVLESRDQLVIRKHSHEIIKQQLNRVQHGEKFSTHKIYICLVPLHPKVTWKHLTMYPRIHPRHIFILWSAIQKRLATTERLQKFGISITLIVLFVASTWRLFHI